MAYALQPGTEAIDILASTPSSSWRRPRGRPPLRWADQIISGTHISLGDAVTATHDRPSWRSHVRDAIFCVLRLKQPKQVTKLCLKVHNNYVTVNNNNMEKYQLLLFSRHYNFSTINHDNILIKRSHML